MRFRWDLPGGLARPPTSAGPDPGHEGSMMAAVDTANNRVLIWDDAPISSNVAADRVRGQSGFEGNDRVMIWTLD